MTRTNSTPLLLLFGGSFNPPHNGHMRIILETAEALGPEKILIVPCAAPPHKTNANLLPFALRCEMLRAAIGDMRQAVGKPRFPLDVSETEGERDGFSYTIDTLRIFAARFPGMRLVFAMGAGDYSRLNSWKDWRDMPSYGDLVVLPRNSGGLLFFTRATTTFWPEARTIHPPTEKISSAFALPCGGKILYVSQPRLEISSSLARRRYLAGRSLDFLVPPGVLTLLHRNKELAESLWKEPAHDDFFYTE